MRNAEFHHPRLVEVYDRQCLWSDDDDFFVSVVDQTPGARVLDLGCGTGRLAVGLATRGHTVTGIDPAMASLAAARHRPGADLVTWIEGTSSSIADDSFDVAVMTSHVAQFFTTDEEWLEVLGDLRRGLGASGILAFDTRDPRARAWEHWNPHDSRQSIALADGTTVEVWTEVTAAIDDVISFRHHYSFSDGLDLCSESTVRFRSEEQVRASLRRAGFFVDQIYGGWRRQPIGSGNGEILVVARS